MAISSQTNFVNSFSLQKEDINAKNMGHHFNVAGTVQHRREGELGELQRDRDPVSIYPAFFALCTFAALALLLDLNGSFHRSANLLLRAVVAVGKRAGSRP